MPPPRDLLARSRGYICRLRWFLHGCDDDDLLSIFVLAGLDATQRGGGSSLFMLAARRGLMDAMRAQGRMCRSGIEVPLEEVEPRAEEQYEEANARLTVEGLMGKAALTSLETRAIEAFLRGERTLYYGSTKDGEGKRLGNATHKAIKKLRAAAKKGEVHDGCTT